MKKYVLSDICEIGSSKRIHLSDYVDKGIPFYRSKEIIELSEGRSISEKLFISYDKFNEIKSKFPTPETDDILITSVGTLGVVYLVKNNEFYFKDGNLTWLRRFKRELVDVGFLYYWLNSESFKRQISNNNIGAVQKAITIDFLKKVNIVLPCLKTQQAIAKVLSTLDQKIAINNQINAQLEQMAKTLYDYWFVQFDFPDENGKPYKSSGGEMVYNETLKREIPKGWEVKSLGEHITIKRGLSYKSNEIQDKGTPFINLNSFHLDGNFKFEGTKFFTGKIKDNDFICNGDVLIAVTDVTRNADIIGKAFILPNLFDENVVISCDVAKISSSRLNSFYLEKLFNSFHYHEYIKHFASGTLVLHLDVKGITWFETYIPPKDLLNQFELYCQSIHQRMTITQKQNQQLTQLRDFLLPMLMNGQVGVGDG